MKTVNIWIVKLLFISLLFVGVFGGIGWSKENQPLLDRETVQEQMLLDAVLSKYVQKGYQVYGPYKVEKVRNFFAYLFVFKEDLEKVDLLQCKVVDLNQKKVSLNEGDRVYWLKKGKKYVLVKIPGGVKYEIY